MYISDSNKVFYLQTNNYTCFEVIEFDAMGSGANFAIGAYKFNKDIKKALEIAVECNQETTASVTLLEIKKINA